MTTVQQPVGATERAALIVYLLSQGHKFRIAEIEQICGVKKRGAYAIMARISRTVPVYQDKGEWAILNPDELTND